MAIATYAQLRATALRWAGLSGDPDIEDALADSVALAQAEMNHGFVDPSTGLSCAGLRVPEMVVRSLLTADREFERLPPGFLALQSCSAIAGEREVPMAPVAGGAAGLYRGGVSSVPSRYEVQGVQLRILPAPGAGGAVLRLVYYAEVPALSGDNPSFALLRTYPNVHLYGTLRHLAAYQVDDAAAVRWTALFAGAIRAANKASRDR